MRSFPKFAAVLAVLAACGEGPLEPGPYTLEGSWRGRGFPYELALDLEQGGGEDVSGGGEIRSLREEVTFDTTDLDPLVVDTTFDTVVVARAAVEVDGDWGYPEFVLRLRAETYADAVYEGTFRESTPDSANGTLEGSGFQGASIPIVRQTTP